MAGGVTRVDSALGERIYRGVQASWLLKIVATIFSISGDEAIWYAVPSVIITSTYAVSVAAAAVRAADGVLPSGCAEQALCDLFGSASICGLAESLAKLAVRRPRPQYAPQRAQYSLPGEHFSLPSGHSMRSAYLAYWLSRNAHAAILLRALGLGPLPLLPALAWAGLVATARVAKGKHFPLDCLLGLLFGLALGAVVEGPDEPTAVVWRGWVALRSPQAARLPSPAPRHRAGSRAPTLSARRRWRRPPAMLTALRPAVARRPRCYAASSSRSPGACTSVCRCCSAPRRRSARAPSPCCTSLSTRASS